MSEASKECPRCKSKVEGLRLVDDNLKKNLAEIGVNEALPAEICNNCYVSLRAQTSTGGMLAAHEKAKEEQRMLMWKSRVVLIKKARKFMTNKMFSDAAVAYEKYFRTLEVVFDVQPGGLTPEHFKESARTKELTVVASAYWDLLRIYDTSDRYADRQVKAAQKLAEFLRFTPVFPDIIRKAQQFEKQAKNPSAIKAFLKAAKASRKGCFIATSAFEYQETQELQFLRWFRDQRLLTNLPGKAFVNFYYFTSPTIARFLDRNPSLKPLVRIVIRRVIAFLR